jgi:hypothetical protein
VWIIIGDNILCSIKYENSLIFINRYDKSHGIEIACKHCFPNANYVKYNEYSTNRLLKHILLKLDGMKAKENNEPRKFVLELGEFLINEILGKDTKLEKKRHIDN